MKRKQAGKKALKVQGKLVGAIKFETRPLDADVDHVSSDSLSELLKVTLDATKKTIDNLQPNDELPFILYIVADHDITAFQGYFVNDDGWKAGMKIIRRTAAEHNAHFITYLSQSHGKATGQDGFMLQVRRRDDDGAYLIWMPYTWTDGKAVAQEVDAVPMTEQDYHIIPAWWETKKAVAA